MHTARAWDLKLGHNIMMTETLKFKTCGMGHHIRGTCYEHGALEKMAYSAAVG